ncbi:PH domain-containing protein [Streptomyces sp. NPDC048430]|uniref:PH domain-containing protein n=1 Tax=Streptomyces sp. NPDC048430 TaxID=3155388 RepID=UPI00343E01D9
MIDAQEVTCHPARTRYRWCVAGGGTAGTVLAVVGLVLGAGPLGVWVCVGLLSASAGFLGVYMAATRVSAGAYGLHSRTPLRRRTVPWSDIASLRTYIQYGRNQEFRRVDAMLGDGRRWRLPLPISVSCDDRPDFDAKLEELRALHRRHGHPESDHSPVVTKRSAGHSSALASVLCVLLLAGAGLAAWFVPVVGEEKEAWTSAVPCTAETPAAERGECLSTQRAVIARVEVGKGKQSSRLYFADGRPLERLGVSKEGARGFHPGDAVELTVWRHQVREVTGEHHTWREHFPGAGETAVIAAGCLLGAGCPGARVLLRRRGRRLPDDEVLPSALPFVAVLAGTALWLLPLCYLHPTDLLTSPGGGVWAAAGSVATLTLLTWAWRATRVLTPGDAAGEEGEETQGERFLPARFLEHTDYNPNGFGTHIVLGGAGPAVTPHPGPGRFAARRIPVERLTVGGVRRVVGGDGDAVPRGWHIAELDDAGAPVRLAAAPADLNRILHELAHGRPAPDAGRARP